MGWKPMSRGGDIEVPICPVIMAVFVYKAIDATTDDVSGTIAADTPRQARELLRERGLVVRDIADFEPSSKSRGGTRRTTFARAPRRGALRHQATTMIRELSTLLGV